jgi:hypothetical protein
MSQEVAEHSFAACARVEISLARAPNGSVGYAAVNGVAAHGLGAAARTWVVARVGVHQLADSSSAAVAVVEM